MSDTKPIVYIVDDDPGLPRSLKLLLRSVRQRVEVFASARAFLERFDPAQPACLLLDLRMPEMGGLELQEQLKARGVDIPIIIMTAFAEVPVAVRAMQAGAMDFIEKPFSDDALLERIQNAIRRAVKTHAQRAAQAERAAQVERLTPRERDVMQLVVAGQANKQIAAQLGLSAKTVETHRANLMKKLAVTSVADLVRLAQDLPVEGLPRGPAPKNPAGLGRRNARAASHGNG